jgi:hypothetical protein
MSKSLKVNPASCVLVSLDMQDKVIDITWDRDIVRPRAVALTSIAKMLNVPLIKLEHVPSKMGGTTSSLDTVMEGIKPISKSSFSGFGSDEFVAALKAVERSHIIIFGVEAHVCLCQTVLDALEAGYSVFVVADASSSASPYHRDIAYDRMRQAGAVIATAQSLAFELIGRSDVPEFRQVLPFIKDL